MVRDSVLLRFAPAAAASGVLALVVVSRQLSPVPRGIALACVVGSWASASLVQRRHIRAPASVVLAIAAATAAGQVAGGVVYGVACVLLILGCLASMRAARAAPAAFDDAKAPAPVRTLVILFATAVGIAGGLVIGLPRLAVRVERRINALFGTDGIEATAFSTTMVLGATRGMLQSDAIVMRIEGGRPEYLRGAVYDRYEGTHWTTSGVGRDRKRFSGANPAGSGGMRITLVRGAPNGEDMRWFLPAGACDLGVSTGRIEVDAFGVVRRDRVEEPAKITFRTSGCSTPAAPNARPSATDLDVSPSLRRSLEPIASGWAASARTDREKLDAIKRELARFEYSLAVPRDVGLDPIVDFVTVHRAGHCEMFASAMVLMARTQGIPARVVGGYHVSEVNPITGHAVVRDRNAHAWVEAWVDGAWRGWDPTPVSETFGTSAGALDHLGDLVSEAIDRVVLGIARLGTFAILGVLGGSFALLSAVRWIGKRLRTRSHRRRDARAIGIPLPCFESLTDALASAGHERAESEPIEAFARRLAANDAPWASEVSKALLHYARLRYGGVGDEKTIAQDVDRAARAVRVR